jgi:hypothetical protein
MTSWEGGRKFFLPRIMNEPVTRYSPDGAVLDTCSGCTHHADVGICREPRAGGECHDMLLTTM